MSKGWEYMHPSVEAKIVDSNTVVTSNSGLAMSSFIKAPTLEIGRVESGSAITIHADGKVDINPSLSLDEASELFWQKVVYVNPMETRESNKKLNKDNIALIAENKKLRHTLQKAMAQLALAHKTGMLDTIEEPEKTKTVEWYPGQEIAMAGHIHSGDRVKLDGITVMGTKTANANSTVYNSLGVQRALLKKD